jgi:hypothetical protein
MAGTQPPVTEHHADGLGKHSQSEKIGNRGSVLPHSVCNLLLRQSEFALEAIVAIRFLDGVQVRALEVLDQSERQHLTLVELSYDRGDRKPSDIAGCAHSAFAGDQLVSVANRSNSHGLQEAARAHASFQFGELLGREVTAWLEWVGSDEIERKLARLVCGSGGRRRAGTQERLESAT